MDAVLFGGEPIRDKPTMVARVIDYVRRFYGGEVSDEILQGWALTAVDEVWGDGPKVTKYVPMLALRTVRAHVVNSLAERSAAGETLPPEAVRDTWIWSAEHASAGGPASGRAT